MEKRQIRLIHNDLRAPLSRLNELALKKKLRSRNLRPLHHVWCDIIQDVGFQQAQKDFYVTELAKWQLNQPHESQGVTTTYGTLSLLQYIRAVIRQTDTPSWLCQVPREFGDAREGTLKADEWRVMASVDLPISLVLFWSNTTSSGPIPIGKQHADALDLAMHLMIAVRLACTRDISKANIQAYQTHMSTFLADLPVVLPEARAVCNYHMALHIPEFLRLFGPVHSWWSFPFERLIQKLQWIPTNGHQKTRQVEYTLSTRYIAESNLRGWFTQNDNSNLIQECSSIFEYLFPMKDKGSMGINTVRALQREDRVTSLGTSSQKLPADLKSAFAHSLFPIPKHIKFLSRACLLNGSFICCSNVHIGNSLVCYHPNGDFSLSVVAGQIKYILQEQGFPVLVGIQKFLPLSSTASDPFDNYPDFPAKMYSNALSDLILIELSSVKCHFA